MGFWGMGFSWNLNVRLGVDFELHCCDLIGGVDEGTYFFASK